MDRAPVGWHTTELHPEINVIMSENGSDHVAIPGGSWFLRATFERMGPDLVLSGPDGEKLLVRDYFFSDIRRNEGTFK